LLRVIRKELKEGSVAILSRMNTIPINYERENTLTGLEMDLRRKLSFPEMEKVTVTTIHKMKGLEADTVIIIDGERGRYPWINERWVLNECTGESIEKLIDEERRLLYVAITRARKKTIVITHGGTPPWLQQIKKGSWDNYPRSSKGLIIWVEGRGTVKIKNALKIAGFRYNRDDQGWEKRNGAEIDSWKQEHWVKEADQVQVYLLLEKYYPTTTHAQWLIEKGTPLLVEFRLGEEFPELLDREEPEPEPPAGWTEIEKEPDPPEDWINKWEEIDDDREEPEPEPPAGWTEIEKEPDPPEDWVEKEEEIDDDREEPEPEPPAGWTEISGTISQSVRTA
jgi:hypothetical protein